MGQIYLNGEAYGGGSGGGSVEYGYENPVDQASDGAMYVLLDSNNKLKGQFLYIDDEWVLINGSKVADIRLAILTKTAQRNNSVGTTTYTSTSNCIAIAINFNINGEASTKTLTSPITTDGEVLSAATINTSWSSPNRNQFSTMSFLDISEGDEVTLSNETNSGTYTTQLHAIFSVIGVSSELLLLANRYEAQSDNNLGTSKTVTLPIGTYAIVSYETSGNGATDMGTDISTDADASNYAVEDIFPSGLFASKLMVLDLQNSSANVTFSWLDKSTYVSRGYSIFRFVEPSSERVLYDNGVEEVGWTVSGGTKNSDNIQINTGGGTFTNFAVTSASVDLTGYSLIHVECYYRSQSYSVDLDISSYSGSKFISFTYLTDSSHNECAVGLSDTQTGDTTFRIDSRNGGDGIQKLLYMSLM